MLAGIKQPLYPHHPNGLSFVGFLAVLDKPTERSPRWCQGHRLKLGRGVVEAALPSLIHMPINMQRGPESALHDVAHPIGVITWAETNSTCLVVGGYVHSLYRKNYAEALRVGQWGMSYELHGTVIADPHAEIWEAVSTTFIGACVLPNKDAAEPKTWFTIG